MGTEPVVNQQMEILTITADKRLMLEAAEVAQLLSISTRTLWRLLSTNRLPAPLRIGGCVRWRLDTVTKWIDQGCPIQDDGNRQVR